MNQYQIKVLIVFSILIIAQSGWSQNLLEIEGELTVNPNNLEIDVHNNRVANVNDPFLPQDAATKAYIDNLLLSFGVSIGPTGIQGLLSIGISPLDIVNAGADTIDFIGLNHAGGIIFYMEKDGTGLVASTIDASTELHWGNSGVSGVGCNAATGATLTGIGDGVTNTLTVLDASCDSTGSAFSYVDTLSLDDYTDWFIPSKDELNLMWKNLYKFGCPNVAPNSSPCSTSLGGFMASYYWSSSENESENAWFQDFFDGYQSIAIKDNNSIRVRAIRAF